MKYRTESNLLTSQYSATNAIITTNEKGPSAVLGAFANPNMYLEVLASTTSGSTGSIRLRHTNAGSTDVQTIALSSVGTSLGLVRSAAFTGNRGGGGWYLVVDAAGTAKTVVIKAARVIYMWDTATDTQAFSFAEIGGTSGFTTTATTATTMTNPKYWKYTAANWFTEFGVTFNWSVSWKSDSTKNTQTAILQEDNGSLGGWTDLSTIAITATTVTYSSGNLTPTDGRSYRIAVKTTSTKNTVTIYNASIIANLSWADASTVKFESQYLLANTLLAAGTGLQTFLTSWDSTEWVGVLNTYDYQVDSTADSSVVEADTSGGVQVAGSSVTSSSVLVKATTITMPTTQNLDCKATTNNGGVAATRIIAVVTAVNDKQDWFGNSQYIHGPSTLHIGY